MKKAGFMVGTALAAFMGAAQAGDDITLEQFAGLRPGDKVEFLIDTTLDYSKKLSTTDIDKALCVVGETEGIQDKNRARIASTLKKYASQIPQHSATDIVEKSLDAICANR